MATPVVPAPLRRYTFQSPILQEMMRLAEDGVMFTIARFENDFCYLGVTQKQMTDFFYAHFGGGSSLSGCPAD